MAGWEVPDEGDLLKNSALRLMFGKCLGSGASRRVYEVLHDKTLVLKVEHAGKTFHNQTEWLIWQEIKSWPIADWFAPCVEIDGYGNVLLQKRTQPFESRDEFCAAVQRTRGGVIPGVFDDIHYANFGLYNDRVACHDYGYHRFFEFTARDMSIDAGYIVPDRKSDEDTHDFTEGGQLALNL